MRAAPLSGPLAEKPRIASIDLLRGIVMVIMALDHTRDYFHLSADLFDPTDLTQTTPALFFTRWITHFCAPAFVLLSGMAIRISLSRKSKRELSLFLLSRGLWLIFLEVFVMRFIFTFNFYFDIIIFQVIWAIGASMVVMSVMVFANARAILVAGLLITFGHNLLDPIQLKVGDAGLVAWTFFEQFGFLMISANTAFLVLYPLLPWLGIMLVGYSIGRWYQPGNTIARKFLTRMTGIAAIVLFLLLRYFNLYGDSSPWTHHETALFSIMSFLNCTKYPVSLLYILMTLGPVLLLLSFLDNVVVQRKNPLLVFGRVPLFYYVTHFFLIHATALLLYMTFTHILLDNVEFHFSKTFGGIPFGYGYGLGGVYLAWISVVLIIYPLCKKYNAYKSTHKYWWLSYL